MRPVDAELVRNIGADAHRALGHIGVERLDIERREQIAAEQIVAFEIRGVDSPIVENLLRVARAVAFPFLRRTIDRVRRKRPPEWGEFALWRVARIELAVAGTIAQ